MVKDLQDVSLSNSNLSLNSIENTTHSLKDQNERTVYLGDLDIDTNEKELSQYFQSRAVPVVKIVKQPHSSFAHVTFYTHDMAKYFLESTIIELKKNRIVRVMPFNQPNNFDPEANLIIKNLEAHLNESHIIQKFRNYGDILSCKLVRDERGESKCYAYLQYKSRESAAQAIDNFNNTYWDERCDPDYKYKKYQELFLIRRNQLISKLGQSNLQEDELFNDFNSKMGKKIYVGVFKKKEEYSRIKSDKDGKPSNLYVKNFGPDFGDRDLFQLFKSFGSIKSAKVRRAKDGFVEKPLGCGFVDFENPAEAEKARQALDGYMLSSGRKISVTYADCKSRRLRKKMEECEIGTRPQQQQQQQQQEQTTKLEQQAEIVLTNVMESRYRKDSLSSNLSSESSATSMSDLNVDLWSRLLNTPNWNEYKLFDSTPWDFKSMLNNF